MEKEVGVEDEERRVYSRRPGPTLNILSQRIKNSRAIPEDSPAPHDLKMLTAEEKQTRPSPNNSHPIPSTKEKPSKATGKNAALTTNNQDQVQAGTSKQVQLNVTTAKKTAKRKHPDPNSHQLRSSTLQGRRVKSRFGKLMKMSETSEEEDFVITSAASASEATASQVEESLVDVFTPFMVSNIHENITCNAHVTPDRDVAPNNNVTPTVIL
jgi:hypothetical protein